MITISTRDYSIEQLKHLSAALYAVKCNVLESKECLAEHFCSPNCKPMPFAQIYVVRIHISVK